MINPAHLRGTIAELGPIYQLGFVPDDFDAALTFWTQTMGVGPFFRYPHISIDWAVFRGGEPGPLDISVTLGYWNDMQIELFELHDDNPSTYREFRQVGRGGVHHISIHTPDKQAAIERVESMGGVLEQEMRLGAIRSLYYRLSDDMPLLEMAEGSPQFHAHQDMMKAAAANWDGSAPLREGKMAGWAPARP